MAGVVPTIEAALAMSDTRRAAAILVAKDVEAMRRREMVNAIGGAMGAGE